EPAPADSRRAELRDRWREVTEQLREIKRRAASEAASHRVARVRQQEGRQPPAECGAGTAAVAHPILERGGHFRGGQRGRRIEEDGVVAKSAATFWSVQDVPLTRALDDERRALGGRDGNDAAKAGRPQRAGRALERREELADVRSAILLSPCVARRVH